MLVWLSNSERDVEVVDLKSDICLLIPDIIVFKVILPFSYSSHDYLMMLLSLTQVSGNTLEIFAWVLVVVLKVEVDGVAGVVESVGGVVDLE